MLPIPRRASARLLEFLDAFPAALIVGPRQAGKSTLARITLPEWKAFDLERPRDLDRASADTEAFLAENGDRVVLDEAQRLPELFTTLRYVLDQSKRRGRFVLLGSSSPSLMHNVSESLAGRLGIMELTPLRAVELVNTKYVGDRWMWGGFPAVLTLDSSKKRLTWMESYIQNLVERDLPALGNRMQPERFRKLLMMLTHVHGSLLNVSDLARSLTVNVHTVDDYLDVLEGTFMIRRIAPYYSNVQKRLVKRSKIYIRDTGLLHFLSGLREPADLEAWPKRGHSFEGLVIEEIIALAKEKIVNPGIHYWRTQAGAEVDLIIGDGTRLVPIEVKLGMSIDGRSIAGLKQCMKDLSIPKGYIVARVDERFTMGKEIDVIPWSLVASGDFDFGFGQRR